MSKREKYCEDKRQENTSKGVERRVFYAWRTAAVLFNRRREGNRRLYEVQQAKASAKLDIADEMELLKTMLVDLTEDLRQATVAKNQLKYQYEQCLLRGMSALNIENIHIQQTSMEHSRDLTETSKSMLYSPEKHSSIYTPIK